MPLKIHPFLLLLTLFVTLSSPAQQVTGVWKGKIDRKKVEIKIIQNGDSLAGTSYYYESPVSYRRYSLKGYFDPVNNSVVWWDDKLIEEKGPNISGAGKTPLLSVADFNCPGGGEMFLDGKTAPKDDADDSKGPVALTKTPGTSFRDEWDFVIDNYTTGGNDPELIDSIALVAFHPKKTLPPVATQTKPQPRETVKTSRPKMVAIPPMREPAPKPETPVIVARPKTVEEKFLSRKIELNTEVPLKGDSVELRFYDNAEIDGDSISLFLNGRMLFTHIRLTDRAYTIKLAVQELGDTNELVMVAENLGSIPPNTSYMVAISGDQRYEARLASTENSSAMIRLRKY
jgi:hypothetical protein